MPPLAPILKNINRIFLLITAVSLFSYPSRVSSQEVDLEDMHPHCSEVPHIEFDAENILKEHEYHLFLNQRDSLDAMYCYSIRTSNRRLEAFALWLLADNETEFFKDIGHYRKVILLLEESNRISKELKLFKQLLYNNGKMCTLYTTNKMYDQAFVYAQKYLSVAYELGDNSEIAQGLTLMGRLQRERGELDDAEKTLNEALELLKDIPINRNRSYIYAYLHLSNLKRLQGKYEESKEYVALGLDKIYEKSPYRDLDRFYLAMERIHCNVELGILDNQEDLDLIAKAMIKSPNLKIQYHFIQGLLSEKKGDPEAAIEHYTNASEISVKLSASQKTMQISERLIPLLLQSQEGNSLALQIFNDAQKANNDFIELNKEGRFFQKFFFQLEGEKRDSILLKQELSNSRITNYFVLGLLGLGGILFLISYRSYRSKLKHTEEVSKLNEELEKKNVHLKHFNTEIQKKNKEIETTLKKQLLILAVYEDKIKNLSKMINDLVDIKPATRQKILRSIASKRNEEIVNDISFEFIDLNKDLFAHLSKDYTNLTQNDLKLCSYILLNISPKEIAQLQHKTVDSVRVARSRLRKKLNITDNSTTLISFLSSYRHDTENRGQEYSEAL